MKIGNQIMQSIEFISILFFNKGQVCERVQWPTTEEELALVADRVISGK